MHSRRTPPPSTTAVEYSPFWQFKQEKTNPNLVKEDFLAELVYWIALDGAGAPNNMSV